MQLYNKLNKNILKKKLEEETFKRITISFYRYVIIENSHKLRDTLFETWYNIGCFGRIYLATEGINAQMSIPEHNFEKFKKTLFSHSEFKEIPFKIAVEDNGKSFYKLVIKVRNKIVADGLQLSDYDITNVGKHLSAKEWNEAMKHSNSIVVDMRNHYESEIGHFKGALCPNVDTFRDELPAVLQKLKDKKNKKILLYCTGGIRCEKTSAYLKHHGFKDVNQLLGGIIDYKRQIENENLQNNFIGKNFVFDQRLGEKISNRIISKCHQCDKPCDTHTNCENLDCHLLFIQCDKCKEKYSGCCSSTCQDIYHLPIEEQRKLRRNKQKKDNLKNIYKKGRIRPHLKEILNHQKINDHLKQL